MNYHIPLQLHSYWNQTVMLVSFCSCVRCPSNLHLFLLSQYSTFVFGLLFCWFFFLPFFLFRSFCYVLFIVLVIRGIGYNTDLQKVNSKLTAKEIIQITFRQLYSISPYRFDHKLSISRQPGCPTPFHQLILAAAFYLQEAFGSQVIHPYLSNLAG